MDENCTYYFYEKFLFVVYENMIMVEIVFLGGRSGTWQITNLIMPKA